MSGGAAGAESCGEKHRLSYFLLGRTGLFGGLGVDLDAIDALRRVSHGYGDQFPVFAWDPAVFPSYNSIQIGPGFELCRSQLRHFFQKTEVVDIVVVRHRR